jgi:hypothetical protein
MIGWESNARAITPLFSPRVNYPSFWLGIAGRLVGWSV